MEGVCRLDVPELQLLLKWSSDTDGRGDQSHAHWQDAVTPEAVHICTLLILKKRIDPRARGHVPVWWRRL